MCILKNKVIKNKVKKYLICPPTRGPSLMHTVLNFNV